MAWVCRAGPPQPKHASAEQGGWLGDRDQWLAALRGERRRPRGAPAGCGGPEPQTAAGIGAAREGETRGKGSRHAGQRILFVRGLKLRSHNHAACAARPRPPAPVARCRPPGVQGAAASPGHAPPCTSAAIELLSRVDPCDYVVRMADAHGTMQGQRRQPPTSGVRPPGDAAVDAGRRRRALIPLRPCAPSSALPQVCPACQRP